MTILLAILIEILSVVGSSVIALKGATDALLQIPENGYKLDMETLQKYQQQYLQNNDKKRRGLAKILLFTPGVNLIFMTVNSYKFKRNVMNDETVRKTLIAMTDDEKEEYAKIDNYFEKVLFTLASEKDAIIRKNSSGIQVGTAAIYNEALPEVYTVEEVKRLNDVTKDTYRLGIIDGVPTAIIGIPGEDRPVKIIKFKDEDYKVSHKYVHISEWTARDKSFVVYPFFNHYPEELEKCNREIIEARNNENVKRGVEQTSVVSTTNKIVVEPQIDYLYEEEDTTIGEVSGPTLVKRGPYKR